MFKSLHDLNTEYHIPGRHACIKAFTGVKFDVSNRYQVLVSEIRPSPLSPEISTINIGDELVSINGIRIDPFDYASSSTGILRATITSWSELDGKTSRLPTSDSVYGFRDQAGRIRSITLPWLATIDHQCARQAEEVTEAIRAGKPIKSFIRDPSRQIVRRSDPATNQTIKAKIHTNPTAHRYVRWAIHTRRNRTLGVITITNFGETMDDAHAITESVRALLLGGLSNTDSIVFDVRSASGSSRSAAADFIPQMFSPTVHLGGIRVRFSGLSERLLNVEDDRLESWRRISHPGTTYQDYVRFIQPIDLGRRWSPVYHNAVALMISGNCRGACDVFVANMKDNNIGIVFGEDVATAGVGSEAVDYNSFLNPHVPDYFTALPYANQMPLAAPNIKVAWKQYIRLTGSIIEGKGIEVYMFIPPTSRDIMNPDTSFTQYDEIVDVIFPRAVGVSTTTNNHPVSTTLPDRIFEIDGEDCLACDQLKDTIISPCGHYCACKNCCDKMENCPMCRKPIDCVVPAKYRK